MKMTISQLLNRLKETSILDSAEISETYILKMNTTYRVTEVTEESNVDEFFSELAEQQFEVMNKITSNLTAHDQMMEIRNYLIDFNHEHGIDKLRRKQSAINEKIQYLTTIQHIARNNKRRKIPSLKECKAMLSDTERCIDVNVALFTDQMLENIDNKINAFKSEIREISDQIATINQTHTVDFDLSFLNQK